MFSLSKPEHRDNKIQKSSRGLCQNMLMLREWLGSIDLEITRASLARAKLQTRAAYNIMLTGQRITGRKAGSQQATVGRPVLSAIITDVGDASTDVGDAGDVDNVGNDDFAKCPSVTEGRTREPRSGSCGETQEV